jgi:hypothetical protein
MLLFRDQIQETYTGSRSSALYEEEGPRCRIGVRHDVKGCHPVNAPILSSRSAPIRDLALHALSKDGSMLRDATLDSSSHLSAVYRK